MFPSFVAPSRCPYLHRVAGDAERRYHLRYYKTCACIYETDARGHCAKNGAHCPYSHGPQDLRIPIYDYRDLQAIESEKNVGAMTCQLSANLESEVYIEDPAWNGQCVSNDYLHSRTVGQTPQFELMTLTHWVRVQVLSLVAVGTSSREV